MLCGAPYIKQVSLTRALGFSSPALEELVDVLLEEAERVAGRRDPNDRAP